MPANTREIRHQDGPSKIGDPKNYPGLDKPGQRRGAGGGGGAADNTEDTIVRIYQLSLASAITAAAARSTRPR